LGERKNHEKRRFEGERKLILNINPPGEKSYIDSFM
jgi:hypothetical protein